MRNLIALAALSLVAACSGTPGTPSASPSAGATSKPSTSATLAPGTTAAQLDGITLTVDGATVAMPAAGEVIKADILGKPFYTVLLGREAGTPAKAGGKYLLMTVTVDGATVQATVGYSEVTASTVLAFGYSPSAPKEIDEATLAGGKVDVRYTGPMNCITCSDGAKRQIAVEVKGLVLP